MSNSYNMVAGLDPLAKLVFVALQITDSGLIPRFRDAYVDVREEPPVLVILTRTGGGNRAEYDAENGRMRTDIPGFIDDRDDEFDSTFAHFLYRIPAEFETMLREAIRAAKDAGWTFPLPMDRFKAALENVK